MSSTQHLQLMHLLHQVYRWHLYAQILQWSSRLAPMFNNIDVIIQFTTEHLDNTGSLLLLDSQLKITREIHIKFYIENSQLRYVCPIQFSLSSWCQNRICHKWTGTHPKQVQQDREIKLPIPLASQMVLKTNRHLISIINQLKYPRQQTCWTHRKTTSTCCLKISRFNKRIAIGIQRAIRRERLDIQVAHSSSSLRRHLSKKQGTAINAHLITAPPITQIYANE